MLFSRQESTFPDEGSSSPMSNLHTKDKSVTFAIYLPNPTHSRYPQPLRSHDLRSSCGLIVLQLLYRRLLFLSLGWQSVASLALL
jgi:hypothetical protein